MKIPNNLIQEINKIVGPFNSKTYKKNEAKFIPVVKRGYLYLNREVNGNIESLVRLEYTGDMNNWCLPFLDTAQKLLTMKTLSFRAMNIYTEQ